MMPAYTNSMPGPSLVYIVTSIIVLAILAIFFISVRKKTGQKQPSGIVFIALFLVIAGILFGEDRLTGYSLIGCGVLLSILDIYLNYRKSNIL
jgi:inner membrane protein involved in colicin E2 resistance